MTGDLKTEKSETVSIPPIAATGRRLGDHQVTPDDEKRCRTLGCHRGRSEGSGHHNVETTPQVRRSTKVLCTTSDHLNTLRNLQLCDSHLQKLCTSLCRIQPDELRLRPLDKKNQAGNSPTRAEVENTRWGSSDTGHPAESSSKPSSMLQMHPNRTRANQPAPLALLQKLNQLAPGIWGRAPHSRQSREAAMTT
jgi:hypothetical protein